MSNDDGFAAMRVQATAALQAMADACRQAAQAMSEFAAERIKAKAEESPPQERA